MVWDISRHILGVGRAKQIREMEDFLIPAENLV